LQLREQLGDEFGWDTLQISEIAGAGMTL